MEVKSAVKILVVTSSISSQNGGVSASILSYYKALKLIASFDVTVVSTLLPNERIFTHDSIANDKNFIFFRTNSRRWRYSKGLNKFLKNEVQNYDVVWVHGIWLSQSYIASRYARKHHIPYVITPHGSLNPYAIKLKGFKKNIYWRLVEKDVFKKATAIHCLTSFEEREVQKMTDSKTFVLPNTIEAGVFEAKDYDALNAICFIGRFHPKKGLDLLLEALKDVENIKLLIAGDGEREYEEYIYGLIEKFELKNRVKFFGFADDSLQKEIYKQSLFCVMPSHSEGLAMVGLESLAHSTPVLATAQCDFEIIGEYDAGIVIENNRPEVIREGIKEMMAKDIGQMSKNAHYLAKEYFDLEVLGKRLLEQFELIVK